MRPLRFFLPLAMSLATAGILVTVPASAQQSE
ncbi:hypothetical protein OKW46_006928 [Paraburkholderia sp. WSM4179]|nr:hypothetical protein [Paraburkholderia sp. WSM4179]